MIFEDIVISIQELLRNGRFFRINFETGKCAIFISTY